MVASTRGTRGTRPERRYKVYRLRDASRRLVYLGYTREPLQRRLDRHARQDRSWFARVDLTRTLVDLHDTPEEMMARYRELQAAARQAQVKRDARPRRAATAPKARPIPGADAPTILSRITARRASLREIEDALGARRGSASYGPKGEIVWTDPEPTG